MKFLTEAKEALTKFHEDEDGLEALQIVMILAIAAIILIFVKTQWGTIKSWATDLLKQITDFKS